MAMYAGTDPQDAARPAGPPIREPRGWNEPTALGEGRLSKMTKAIILLVLICTLPLAFAAIGAMYRWEATSEMLQIQPAQGYDTAHLAPREDDSLQ